MTVCPSPCIQLEHVTILRGEAEGPARPVIRDLSLRIETGQRVFLVGPNGAGKTSLLLALVGALAFEGRILIDGIPLSARTQHEVRQRIGFVFADPSEQLFSTSVEEEVAFGPRQRKLDAPIVKERVRRALEAVGLDGYEQRSPFRLSLGEQRRLAVATALAVEPSLLIFDEPTASLDPKAREDILNWLGSAPATLISATHDLDAVLDLAAHVVLLNQGCIVESGPAEQLLRDAPLLERAGLALPLSLKASRK